MQLGDTHATLGRTEESVSCYEKAATSESESVSGHVYTIIDTLPPIVPSSSAPSASPASANDYRALSFWTSPGLSTGNARSWFRTTYTNPLSGLHIHGCHPTEAL